MVLKKGTAMQRAGATRKNCFFVRRNNAGYGLKLTELNGQCKLSLYWGFRMNITPILHVRGAGLRQVSGAKRRLDEKYLTFL